MAWTHRSNQGTRETFRGKRRAEHWYRDNQVYFITARCRARFPAFAREEAKTIFWDRFASATEKCGFDPWLTSLLDNHYHTLGYLRHGPHLARMMQLLHGGVSKLVNDLLEVRHVPFWEPYAQKSYFDGCLRDEKQLTRSYRYTLKQAVRHGIVSDWRLYPHTRANLSLEEALEFATARRALLYDVPYRRYEREGRGT